MPKIFFSVFFIRDDTHFNLLNIFSIFKDIYTFLKYKNFILLLSLCCFTLVFFLLIIKKFFQKKKNKIDLYFIFYTWLFISFIYILLSSNVEFKEFLSHRPSALFRHLFFYSIFVIPLFFILKNDFFCQFYKKYFNIFFYFFLLLFLLSFSSYIFERDQQIKDLKYRKIFLTQALDNLNIDKSKLAFYGDNGYFYAEEFMHFYANSTFAGEKYNSQLFQKFSSFKYFKGVDFKYYAYNINSNDSFQIYKSWYNSWDKILKEKLNNKLYLILSHNSLKETANFPGNRKLEFFINPSNSKINYILLYGPDLKIKENNYNDKDYVYKLSKYLNIKNIKIINLGNDTWYLITLNKEI
jgi:hypothetical protein